MTSKTPFTTKLYTDLHRHIISFLPSSTVYQLTLTCKEFQNSRYWIRHLVLKQYYERNHESKTKLKNRLKFLQTAYLSDFNKDYNQCNTYHISHFLRCMPHSLSKLTLINTDAYLKLINRTFHSLKELTLDDVLIPDHIAFPKSLQSVTLKNMTPKHCNILLKALPNNLITLHLINIRLMPDDWNTDRLVITNLPANLKHLTLHTHELDINNLVLPELLLSLVIDGNYTNDFLLQLVPLLPKNLFSLRLCSDFMKSNFMPTIVKQLPKKLAVLILVSTNFLPVSDVLNLLPKTVTTFKSIYSRFEGFFTQNSWRIIVQKYNQLSSIRNITNCFP